MIKTELCEMLGIKYPIIQAAMGPLNTKKLASAVTNAGGLGTLSIFNMGADPVEAYNIYSDNIKYVMSHSDGNFACNVPIGAQIGPKFLKTTDAYLNAVFDARKDPEVAKRHKLLITSAGNPERYMDRFNEEKKKNKFYHFHVVGSVHQAKKMESWGVDGVIASGFEMGGHTHRPPNVVHTFILVPSVTDAVNIPVIASGGVCDSKTFTAALAMGAVGVQMGTRFGASEDCDFHDNYKKAILDCKEYGDMVCPGAYSYARVVRTEGAVKAVAMEESGKYSHEEMVDLFDRNLVLAEEKGDIIEGEVGGGQCSSRINSAPSAKDIIDEIMSQSVKIIEGLGMLVR